MSRRRDFFRFLEVTYKKEVESSAFFITFTVSQGEISVEMELRNGIKFLYSSLGIFRVCFFLLLYAMR
jgi:hypothetical protein